MLHVFWGIVFFDGCEKNKWYILLTVLLTHLLVSTQVSADEWWVPLQRSTGAWGDEGKSGKPCKWTVGHEVLVVRQSV